MSVAITDSPNSLTVKGQPLVWVCTSTNQAQTGFKFIVVVKNEAGTQIAKYYIPKNPADVLIFDLQDVVREGVKTDTVDSQQADAIIHTMPHATDKFMTVGNTGCKLYEVEFGEVYGDPLTEYTNLNSDTVYLIDGYLQVKDGYQNTLSDYQPNGAAVKGFLTNRVSSYISVAGASRPHIRASESDYGTLAFLNDDGTVISSGATKLQYQIYDSAGLQGTDTFTIGSAYGGESPSSTVAEDKLLYFGALPGNVNDADHPVNVLYKPSAITDWAYYTWRLYDTAGTTPQSLPFLVVNTPFPCKHTPVMVAWTNPLGAWEYLRFDARPAKTLQATSKNYQQTVGTYEGTTFGYDTFSRQTTPYHVESTKNYTLKSDFLTFEETELCTYLLKSKNVMMYMGEWLPIVVSTNSVKYETEQISKRLTVELNVELAQREVC